ncbi:MAG: helix-turn-helix domain-containing protein [Pseudotabrizicola sp.]|uniref:helix-turn-helix domain-containing protein n=1 Tax=Pseudotabrizicola sp. TaxID=2939647 RepID=UPI00271E31FA|nr:helix-turn-helix domain-containing protein [Pseudotabrizicola sp.]MDO9639126.1 helix-turn-helix domain-containing protein [Pseudotabrizicola sp.]
MRHHRKLTDDERHQIIEARAAGTPVKALARQFRVSRRTIYNTLNKAQGAHPARTQTISIRVSRRELAGFKDGMEKRGITDHPAALRCLMGAADALLRPADPAVIDHLKAWGAQVATQGAAVNHIARKLNEAKLRGRPLPFTEEDLTTIRTFARGFLTFAEGFRILWEAQQAAMTREVNKALEGLATKAPAP